MGEAHIMKVKTRFFSYALLALFIAVSTVDANAQRLYDEGRDKKAQEAAALAEEITSKSTFDKQLKNLDTLSKRDMDLYFQGAKRQMELQIRGFRTWGNVSAFVGSVETTLSAADFISDSEVQTVVDDLEKDCPQRTTELGKAICAAQAELKNLKDAVAESEKDGKALDEELKTRLEKIGVVESLVDKAETFLTSKSKNNQTIKDLTDVFINLSKSYVSYTNKLKEINNQPKDELRLLLQRIAVETLQLEADHWKTVAEIKLRRVEEQKELSSMARQFDNRLKKIAGFSPCLEAGPNNSTADERLKKLKDERISETFAKVIALTAEPPADGRPQCVVDDKLKSKEELATFLYQTLHLATALAARGETPMKLASLRLAQEEHAYSIRQSAIVARGYELAIGSGTKRLARFYAGGLRPEKIAQLIYTAATVAIPAVIAGK
jgi:hypothetical protein